MEKHSVITDPLLHSAHVMPQVPQYLLRNIQSWILHYSYSTVYSADHWCDSVNAWEVNFMCDGSLIDSNCVLNVVVVAWRSPSAWSTGSIPQSFHLCCCELYRKFIWRSVPSACMHVCVCMLVLFLICTVINVFSFRQLCF